MNEHLEMWCDARNIMQSNQNIAYNGKQSVVSNS